MADDLHDVSITVRRAGMDDLEAVAELFDRYRLFYAQQRDVSGARAFLRERMEKDESVILIATRRAERHDVPAGFTQLYPMFSSVRMIRTMVLNDLFVHPDHRRLGIARALLAAAAGHAHHAGAKRLELSTGIDNHAARTLYEQDGWRVSTGFVDYTLML